MSERSLTDTGSLGRKVTAWRLAQLVTVASVATYGVGVSYSTPAVRGVGLAMGVHPLAWVGLGGLFASFTWALRLRPTARVSHLILGLGILTAIHGLPLLIEGTPRFPFSYRVFGHVERIVQSGYVHPDLFPYQNWPGFMLLAAVLSQATGLGSLSMMGMYYVFHQWAVFLVAFLIAGLLFRQASRKWSVVWLFSLVNWVGQGYFVPATLGLLIIALVGLVLLRAGRVDSLGRPAGRAAWSAVMVVLIAALVITHFLTSLVLLLLLALVQGARAIRRHGATATTTGATLCGVLILLWLMYSANDFFVVNLPKWVDQALSIGLVTEQSATFAFSGSTTRLLVSRIKTGFLAMILILGTLGFLRSKMLSDRGRVPPYVLPSLLIASFAIVPATAYGGEIVSRAFSYAMLPLAMFSGYWAVGPKGRVVLLAAVAASGPLFFVSAYGNEAFDYVAPTELYAQEFFEAHAAKPYLVLSTSRTQAIWSHTGSGLVWTNQIPDGCGSSFGSSSDSRYMVIHSSRDREAFDYLGVEEALWDVDVSCLLRAYDNGVTTLTMTP